MPGLIEHGSQKVVHCRIDDHEVLRLARFQVLDPGQQHARVAGDHPARLDGYRQCTAVIVENVQQRTHIVGRQRRCLRRVANPETSTQVQVLELDIFAPQLLPQRHQPPEGVGVGADVDQL